MSKSPGKSFERDFRDSIPDRCDVTRLKDAGGWSNATNMRFTSSNPCDVIIYSDGGYSCGLIKTIMYKLELKSTLGKSLLYGNIKASNEKRTAKENSIKFTKVLVDSENKGVWAGFIVNFRVTNQTFRVLASEVLHHLETAGRASIPIAWFEENGTLIKQTLKKIHYRYDLEWL
jgi:recombination protein U